MPQLYDYAGRPIKLPTRPETREIAAVSLQDRWSSYPSAGLTPGRLAAIFRAADAGDLRSQAELFEDMEEKDLHLASVMQTRRLAVLGLDRQVEAASDSAEDKKIADFCRGVLDDLDYESFATHLLGALGHGYAGAEPKWATGTQWTIAGFNLIHPKNITWLNSLTPLVITQDNYSGVEPVPFQLIYHSHLAKSGHDTRNGVLRVCGYMYLFKNYALKDWAAFNEIFGMPLRLGKYEPSATPADRDALRQAIMNLGADAAGVISKSTEIEFIEASSRLSGTTNPYEVMANFCNREMSKAVLGQTLTTDTQGSTGTYAAGKVQADVRQDLLEADANALSKTIRMQLLRPLVGFNFGWDKPVPGFSLPIQDSPDLKDDSEIVKNLKEAGFGKRIPLRYANDHFGIPEPKEGEETLETVPATKTPAGGPGQPLGGPAQKTPEGLKVVLTLREGELDLIPQDRQVIQTQQELEQLTQAALEASVLVVAGMLKPVNDLIESGASLEAIRDGLVAVYPEMPAETLGELLYQARMRAYMKGWVENA
jgi:phage gp29-like protein